jgi:hypothetical protein
MCLIVSIVAEKLFCFNFKVKPNNVSRILDKLQMKKKSAFCEFDFVVLKIRCKNVLVLWDAKTTLFVAKSNISLINKNKYFAVFIADNVKPNNVSRILDKLKVKKNCAFCELDFVVLKIRCNNVLVFWDAKTTLFVAKSNISLINKNKYFAVFITDLIIWFFAKVIALVVSVAIFVNVW